MVWRLCERCLKHYKRRVSKAAKRGKVLPFGKGNWPARLYHEGGRSLCDKHWQQRTISSAMRRVQELRAMPRWADRDAIAQIYVAAEQKTRSTGTSYQVDHIVPLRHPRVCGLHVEHNLQVITAGENARKGNRFQI